MAADPWIVADQGTTWDVKARLGTRGLAKSWQITLIGVPSDAWGIGIPVPCLTPVTVPAADVIAKLSFTSNAVASALTEIVP